MRNLSAYFETPSTAVVHVDWKEEAAEVLAALRGHWAAQIPALGDGCLDEIVEHYSHESTEIFLRALGQELSCLELLLYELPTENDEYRLVVIPVEDAAAFELSARKHKTKAVVQKQSRRESGTPARRVKLAGAIPCDKIRLHTYRLTPMGNVAFAYEGAGQSSTNHWLDLCTWPPGQKPAPRFTFQGIESAMTFEQAAHDGVFAIVTDHADRSGSYPINRAASLHVSRSPLIPDSWEPVRFPESLDTICTLHFGGTDLLIVQANGIFVVPDIKGSGRTAHRLLTVEPVDTYTYRDHPGEFPWVATTRHGEHVVQLAGKFYLWTGSTLRQLDWPLRKVSNMYTAATPNGFCYIHCVFDRTVPRLDTYLVEFDTRTGRERARRMQFLRASSWPSALPNGWVVFTQNGDPDKTEDLAQLWHMPTDRWFRLRDGCLGCETLTRVFAAPDGHLLAHSRNVLFRLPPAEELSVYVSKTKNGCLVPAPWSDWCDSAPGIAGEWRLPDAWRDPDQSS